LNASLPADGARVSAPPRAVELIFNGAVEERFASASLFRRRR
jgi:methionine-rich copper-binding protein CopC